MSERAVYTPADVAERWGCSTRHVRNLMDRGELAFFKIGRLRRIRADALREFEKRQTITSKLREIERAPLCLRSP